VKHICKVKPSGLQGLQEKGLQEVQLLVCSFKIISACRKKYSLFFPDPEKQTHCLSLRKKKGSTASLFPKDLWHKSFGERPCVDGCSRKGHVAHPVHHEHFTSHK